MNKIEKTQLEKESVRLLDVVNETEKYIHDYYANHLYEKSADETKNEVYETTESLRRASNNLLKIYTATLGLADELKARWKDWKKSKKKSLIYTPANGVIDIEEKKLNHFARGVNFYKMIWLLFIGSFAGVIVELSWVF